MDAKWSVEGGEDEGMVACHGVDRSVNCMRARRGMNKEAAIMIVDTGNIYKYICPAGNPRDGFLPGNIGTWSPYLSRRKLYSSTSYV